MKNIIAYNGYSFSKLEFEYKSFTFPGGEIHIQPQNWYCYINDIKLITIQANIKSAEDIMTLLCLTDALRRYYHEAKINLDMSYLPYARQDRVANPGESLSLKVFCDLINSQNYNKVEIWDCHSDVGLALLNNVRHVPQHALLRQFKSKLPEDVVLVAPDAGAMKKCLKCSQELGLPMVTASKVRDTNTGEITGTHIDLRGLEKQHGRRWLIVDDICDGGRTFIELAKAIYNTVHHNGVYLYVTHGIFSKGFDVFREEQQFNFRGPLIQQIYVANSFVDDVPDFVTKLQ